VRRVRRVRRARRLRRVRRVRRVKRVRLQHAPAAQHAVRTRLRRVTVLQQLHHEVEVVLILRDQSAAEDSN
jgi:hypothetical protein